MRIERVRKRDGREEAFDAAKIASAIFRAARSIGGEDRRLADELASVVVHFLEKHAESPVPSVEEIQDMVEKVLIETGHARTAKAFILYRDRRVRLREDLQVRRIRPLLDADELPSVPWVASGRDDAAEPWSKARIAEDLERRCGLPASASAEIAACVEDRVLRCGLRRLSTNLIREFVEHELTERGLAGPLLRYQKIGVPLVELERLLRGEAPEGSDPREIREGILDALFRSYWLSRVFSADVVEAHATGRLRLVPLGDPFRLLAAERAAALLEEGEDATRARTWRVPPGVALPPGAARAVLRIVRAGDEGAAERLRRVAPGDALELRLPPGSAPLPREALAGALAAARSARARFGRAAASSGFVLSACAVNVPRVALRGGTEGLAGRTGPIVAREDFFLEIDSVLDLAVRAHGQRRRFLATAGGAARGGALAARLEACEDVVELFGLREAVEFLAGEPLCPGGAADALLAEVLLHAEARLGELSVRERVRATLGSEAEPSVGLALARADSREYPWETGLMGSALRPPGGAYSAGALPVSLLRSEPPRSMAVETGLLPVDLGVPGGVRPDDLVDRLAFAAEGATLLRAPAGPGGPASPAGRAGE